MSTLDHHVVYRDVLTREGADVDRFARAAISRGPAATTMTRRGAPHGPSQRALIQEAASRVDPLLDVDMQDILRFSGWRHHDSLIEAARRTTSERRRRGVGPTRDPRDDLDRAIPPSRSPSTVRSYAPCASTWSPRPRSTTPPPSSPRAASSPSGPATPTSTPASTSTVSGSRSAPFGSACPLSGGMTSVAGDRVVTRRLSPAERRSF